MRRWEVIKKLTEKARRDGIIGLFYTSLERSMHALQVYRLRKRIGFENIGKNVVFGSNVNITCKKIKIADNVYIGSYSKFWGDGEIEIGEHSYISDFVSVYSDSKVRIGEHTIIASFSFIIDTDHGIARHNKIHYQPKVSKPVDIGSDVWIAASCLVLSGAKIGDGAVIAANSVVKHAVPPYAIAAGSPAVIKKKRE
jgi:acetyltransferase-like isoleucine patch superfamily enzyme